jgi:rhodanese-related sulfurtransferase
VADTDSDDRPSHASSLEPERVAEMQRAGELELIDVRQPDEWELGHIPGARHIVLEELPSHADSISRQRPVVFHCRSGNRSAMAADAFAQAGYDAYNLAGGVLAWQESGLPLEPEGAAVSGR